MVLECETLDVRPYQLMHIVSRIGAGCGDDMGDARLTAILRAVRKDPLVPMTLRCNVNTAYDYQNPGKKEDTPEGEPFNVRRDLKILQMLGLAPGDTRPALEVFSRLLKRVETARNLLWFEEPASQAWKGESREDCHYEKGRQMGLDAIIPLRSEAQLQADKQKAIDAIRQAEVLRIRPHHLLCAGCSYGERLEGQTVEETAIFTAIRVFHENPQIPIKLNNGPGMICAACPNYHTNGSNGPKCLARSNLRDQLKDLEVLRLLGLKYGDTLPARELFARLFERIDSTRDVCSYGDGIERAEEWTICGAPEGNPNYAKARQVHLGFPKD